MNRQCWFLINIVAIIIIVMNVHSQTYENMPGMQEDMPGMSKLPDQNNLPSDISRVTNTNKKSEVIYSDDSIVGTDSTLKPQSICPVMGGLIDKKLFVDYKNVRIYVCCERCKPIILKQPEKALLQLRNLSQRAEIRKQIIKKNLESSISKKDTVLVQDMQQKSRAIPHVNNTDSSLSMMMDSTMKIDKPISPSGKDTNSTPLVRKPQTVVYRLSIGDTIVNYTGKKRKALAINGSIPGPVLTFFEGDTAEIYIHNSLSTETSIHWHGIIVPNRYDGVPYLTTAPVEPGKIRVFRFPIVQSGTYWYHSHTGLQEQLGMYGAFVINKRNETRSAEHVFLLSDWTDENPYAIYRNLTMGSDWFSIKKGSTQSFGEALTEGYLGTKIVNTFKRMSSMDVSDVYYNKSLINGKPEQFLNSIKPGDKVKMRIINGAASTYFWINYAGGPITVVANDGMDVEPVIVDRLIIGVAETYDIIVTVPDSKCYELMATSEDRTISSSVWLGTGPKVSLKPLQKLQYFEGMKAMNRMLKLNGKMDEKGMKSSLQQMGMNSVMYPELKDTTNKNNPHTSENDSSETIPQASRATVSDVNQTINTMDMAMPSKSDPMSGMNMSEGESAGNNVADMPGMEMKSDNKIKTLNYAMLRSRSRTTLPDAPLHTLKFRLSGNMSRYVWTIDNKKVSERDKILIRKGENVRIILHNGTMMRHPMHLHGHFFRVLNGQGDYAPLKTVLDILPMETDTIEFAGSEEGDWAFHCHILYHMMSGMGTVFSYEASPVNPEFANPKKAYRKYLNEDRAIHAMVQAGIEHNGSMGELVLGTTRQSLQGEWRVGFWPDFTVETETHLGRYLGEKQWWFPYIGTDWRYDKSAQPEENLLGQSFLNKNRFVFCAGVQYLAPFFLLVDLRIDQEGVFRTQISQSDLPLTNRLRFGWLVNTNKEYTVRFSYILSRFLSISTHYDSDMKWGAGVALRY